ncbi:MAG: DUF2804 domain-containing protein [Planctomycetota bacterium]
MKGEAMQTITLLAEPPRAIVEGTRVSYGRYRQPFSVPNIRAAGPLGRYRLKEWHYTSFSSERLFIAFALVQLGYVANAFCYVVDHTDGSFWEYEALTPLGRGLRFAPSSVEGASVWRHRRAALNVTWRGGGWDVQLDLDLRGERLSGSLRVTSGAESLALVHPLAPDRPAYTHKAAGLSARAELRWRGETHASDGLAALDWTRSVALRETRWKWASFAAPLPDGRAVGLNLSADVYVGASGESRENALWIDGRVHPLGGVRFELPADPAREPWRIRGQVPGELDLEFLPLGARAQRVDFKLIRSDFVQPYGRFRGSVRPPGAEAVSVEGAFGVVEDHVSLW